MTRLAEFVSTNKEPILARREAFARTPGPEGGAMDVVALRVHAAQMLTVIVADLNTPQGPEAQAEEGKGRAASEPDASPGTFTVHLPRCR